MPSAVTAPDEDRAVTEATGLLDRSERGKLALSGADAKAFLQGQVSNDVEGLSPGRGCYAALLTPKGKMLADLRILDTGDELLLDTERPALQELFNVLRRFALGHAVELHKRTLQRGLLSLIGPTSGATLHAAADGADDLGIGDEEHDHATLTVAGAPARAIRTDCGIDVLCLAEDTAAVAAALRAAGAVDIGEPAAELERVRRGRPRYGVDLDDTVIPQEADLNARAVSFTKGCYVGQETVARLFYRGKPNRMLRGLRIDGPAATGDEIVHGDRIVGWLGSVVRTPEADVLGLALIRREAPVGTEVTVGDAVTATVVELPFT